MRRIAVLGANGRMGAAVTRLLAASSSARLCGALTEPGHASIGADAGTLAMTGALGVCVTDDLDQVLAGADVAIDFTAPAATARNAAACATRGCALVVGTTGLAAPELSALEAAAARVGVVYARNMSLGVNVLTELARIAARLLGPDFDIEITEAHHRHKLDAPSGTALQLGEALAALQGRPLADVAIYERHGVGQARPAGAIGFAATRAGSIVGDHAVILAGEEEVLELRHRATDRALFARGAVRAAEWVADRPAGMYSMRDVLGLAGVSTTLPVD
jgi:4-hydroxy-tetrahydrodipicolinate reductase